MRNIHHTISFVRLPFPHNQLRIYLNKSILDNRHNWFAYFSNGSNVKVEVREGTVQYDRKWTFKGVRKNNLNFQFCYFK